MAENDQDYQRNQQPQPGSRRPDDLPAPPVYQPPDIAGQPSATSKQQESTQPEKDDASQRQQAAAGQQPSEGEEARTSKLEMADGKERSQAFWMSRPHLPDAPDIPEEAMKRHEESLAKYPGLNLSKGEFVISAVRRHPIGLLSIWFVSGLVVLLSLVIIIFFFVNQSTFLGLFKAEAASASIMGLFLVVFFLLAGISILGGFISTYVYMQNKFFLTNESVVQFIQISIFSRKEQTVSLNNIEDASYRQHGILQHILNYGAIRLSTQGDETTYRFSYVKNPKHQIALLNNAVEAFKNGRPVMHLENRE